LARAREQIVLSKPAKVPALGVALITIVQAEDICIPDHPIRHAIKLATISYAKTKPRARLHPPCFGSPARFASFAEPQHGAWL
jgi:hypothetical protein